MKTKRIMSNITQKEIADHLSISQGLVSDVLTGRRKVTTPLHRKIMAMSKEYSYEPNHAARSLRTGRQKAWNILLTSFVALADFNRSIIQGIAKVALEQGFSISISTLNDVMGVDGFVRGLREKRFDGVFILEDIRKVKEQLDNIVDLDVSAVIVNCPLMDERFNCVYSDGAEGIYRATRHLIEDCGRRKVSAFFYADDSALMQDRYRGFLQAHKDLGVVPGPEFRRPDYSPELGYEGFGETSKALLREHYGEFDAVVCPGDYLAVNVMSALMDLGLKVPEEVSVVGFDDLPLATAVRPQLTTVACDGIVMGETAARILVDRISHPDTRDVKHIKIPTKIVIRKSSFHSCNIRV
jgi:DNA-binding LacI/PurR family transcriptional regulator